MYVYKIINKITSDIYIGKTTNPISVRFNRHCYLASLGSDTYLHRAIRKYGQDNFEVTFLEEYENLELLNEGEKCWINNLKPNYNMTIGGDGGDTSASESYKEYMKLRSKLITGELNPFYGKRHTTETKQKISKSKLGTILSEETKQKISKSNLGKKMSRESVEKTRLKNSKTYYLISPSGEPITVTNLSEYCRMNNLDQRNMNNMYNGVYKSSKGYRRNNNLKEISSDEYTQ
jgi:group I intron endonuclease